MPQFGFTPENLSFRRPNTGAVPGINAFAREAATFGAPTAAAIDQQAPAPAPDVGERGAPELDMLLQGLLGAAPAAGGVPFAASLPVAPPMPAPPSPVITAAPPPPLPAPEAPPIGIAIGGEDFPQAFRATNGRYPTPRDYEERAFVFDFMKRVGRMPTKMEALIRMLPAEPRPYDGEPEWEEAPGGPALGGL